MAIFINDCHKLVGLSGRVLILLAALLLIALPTLADQPLKTNVKLSAKEREWLAEDHLVRIRVGHYPPLMFVDNSRVEGIAIDYLEQIFKAHGIRYQYVLDTEVSWKEALQYMRDHDVVDMVPTAKVTDERKTFLTFSDEYLFMPWVIFTRDDAPFVSGIEDLFGKTVAVPEGFVMQKLLSDNYPEIQLEVVKGPGEMEKCIKSLSYGKTDALVENLTLGTYFINNYGYTNLKVAAPTPFGNHNQAMAMRNDWPELAGIINKSLQSIPQGEKTEIINRWMSVRYEHGLDVSDIFKWVGGVIAVALMIMSMIMLWNRKLHSEILARKEAEAQLKEANAELDAYVHTVTHDLRTPLGPITGYAEILLSNYHDHLDAKALQYLQAIVDSGHRMGMLLEDLLNLATVGKVDRPLKPQDSRELALKVVKDLSARQPALEARIEVAHLPLVLIHRTHLEQMFSNLIGNAIKYAGEQSGVIAVGGERKEQKVTFFVRDHGPGIAIAEQEKVFEVFYRGSRDGENFGTGVGLATVQKIATHYQGRAWVETTPGGGCTFFVEFVDGLDSGERAETRH